MARFSSLCVPHCFSTHINPGLNAGQGFEPVEDPGGPPIGSELRGEQSSRVGLARCDQNEIRASVSVGVVDQ